MMSSLLRELAEEATMAATGEWDAWLVRRWVLNPALHRCDRRVENRQSSGGVAAWRVVVLVDARGARGMGARGLRGGLSGSSSLLSQVEPMTESEKGGILWPVVLTEPRARWSGQVRGRRSTRLTGDVREVAARHGFRAKGGRTLLLRRDLQSLAMTG
jgi:hypothetical protein